MAQILSDVFILFNEEENDVEKIVEALEKEGIKTYFWRRDIKAGSEWEKTESDQLISAKLVLIFLGEKGWGPNHLRITNEARNLNKRFIPVLIGEPSNEAYGEAGELFKKLRYVDLKKGGKDNFNILLKEVKRAIQDVSSSKFDQAINTIIDGNEEQRANLLEQIISLKTIDRISLCARIRTEISQSFEPGNERIFATAVRDPKKISSIRSWMLSALIWADAENPENKKVILEHLSSSFEPEENVRYWTLAGLYQKNVPYLNEAISITMSGGGVDTLLAAAIKNGSDQDQIEKFRTELLSGDFETSWRILRILRVVAIPDLARDVCNLLNSTSGSPPIVYDSFYALTNPEMARAASSILQDHPGTKSIVNRIINVVSGSNLNAVKNFSGMLLTFNEKEVNSVLEENRLNPETQYIANQIKSFLRELRGLKSSENQVRAGYASDAINTNDDQLEIARDVQTLTAIMLAKDVSPPLAIGLFGDWGMGKSFFMQSIKSEVEKIKERNSQKKVSAYCKSVVQIDFNAWHYVDTNLWASLVSSIFEKLASHVSPKPTDEEKQASFFGELGSTKMIIKEAEIEKENTQKLINDKQAELQNIQRERQEKQVTLKDLQISDLNKALTEEEKKEINNTLSTLGIAPIVRDLSELKSIATEINTVRGRLSGIFFSLINSKNITAIIALLIAILIIIPLGLWVVHKYLNVSELVTKVSAFLGEILATGSFIIIALKSSIEKVKAGVTLIETTQNRINSALESKRKNPTKAELALQEEVAKLIVKERESSARIAVATDKLIQIEEKLKSLQEEKSLNRFLIDRLNSNDYKRHLGLISTIRQDFELLSERLKSQHEADKGFFNPVDRIILYIDDLDRCPVNKVMEVLQAVHLLLAYPLFIVVVGVDPRWLLHSLDKTFDAFQNTGTQDQHNSEQWRTTPQNFLEKIFQIPYTLKPMSNEGYSKLMHKLLIPSKELGSNSNNSTSPNETSASLNPTENKSGGAKDLAVDSSKSVNTTKNLLASSNVAGKESSSTRLEENEIAQEIDEESLIVTSWESDFADNLFAFIPSPRAAKRFSNVYRILKASVPRDELKAFEGSKELPGNFQVPMLLLGILIGAPKEASYLFPHLIKHSVKGNNIKFAVQENYLVEKQVSSFPDFKEKINQIINLGSFPSDPSLALEWAPKVARFSFDLGKIRAEYN